MSLFGKRDLEILLPDAGGGDLFSLRHTVTNDAEENYSVPEAKLDKSKKVERYRAGVKPKFLGDDEDQDNVGFLVSTSSAAVEDSRLARLGIASSEDVPRDANQPRARRVYEATVLESSDDDSSESSEEVMRRPVFDGEILDGDAPIIQTIEEREDEDEIAARRARIKERMRTAQVERASVAQSDYPPPASQRSSVVKTRYASESESEESETESESSEEIMKPVFVPRAKRETIIELNRKYEEEERKAEVALQKKEQKKVESRSIVAESIRKLDEKNLLNAVDMSDAGMPDDIDDPEDETEFENWKLRELNRLKRDALAREARELDKADLLRRRNMSDAERLEEDRKEGKFDKEKSQRKFMQKYYHKGAFYMDDDSLKKEENDVRTKTYEGATGEDNFNFEALPQVLQVKNFGKRGRTKYTHLLDQDTTTKGEGYRIDRNIMDKYLSKRAGVGDIDNAGRAAKKPK